jgi:hypothetical protein
MVDFIVLYAETCLYPIWYPKYGTPFAHINIQHICNFFSGSMNELLSGLICILTNFLHV